MLLWLKQKKIKIYGTFWIIEVSCYVVKVSWVRKRMHWFVHVMIFYFERKRETLIHSVGNRLDVLSLLHFLFIISNYKARNLCLSVCVCIYVCLSFAYVRNRSSNRILIRRVCEVVLVRDIIKRKHATGLLTSPKWQPNNDVMLALRLFSVHLPFKNGGRTDH